MFSQLEAETRASLNDAEERARPAGARMMMIGILPTVTAEHLNADSFSANPRYELLNQQIFAARGEDLEITIAGVERLSTLADTIAPEAACTSVQLHQQVGPDAFARYWNAAQAIAGVQVAIAANSPFFCGKELWRETRIALFEQATDTRPGGAEESGRAAARVVRRALDHVDLRPVRGERPLLPGAPADLRAEDPLETLERGDVPRLGELRLHNGTIYRWNRPIYDVVRDQPHVRVENRILPAGPTMLDILANAAFYYGLVRVIAEEERPLWSRMSFSAAEENFHAGARDGIEARVYWPGVGEVPVAELVLRRLLPLAREGLERWGVDTDDADRLLGVIERRCVTLRNGAAWQAQVFHSLYEAGGLDRAEALRQMTRRYREHMHSNEPVHTWPLD